MAKPRSSRSSPSPPSPTGPDRLWGLASRPITWIAGVLAATLVAVLTAWVPQHGRDTVAGWTNSPVLRVVSVRSSADDYVLPGAVTTAGDRAILLDPAARSSEAMPEFLRRHGAAAAGQIHVRIVLEGGRNSLRITDLRLRTRKVTDVLSGTYLGTIGAGVDDSIQMSADLDSPDTVLRVPDPPHEAYFSTKQIDLARGERETLDITVTASRKTFEFDFLATVVSDGEHEQVIGGAGDLLRVTGALPDYHGYRSVLVSDVGSGFSIVDKATLCDLFVRSKGC